MPISRIDQNPEYLFELKDDFYLQMQKIYYDAEMQFDSIESLPDVSKMTGTAYLERLLPTRRGLEFRWIAIHIQVFH